MRAEQAAIRPAEPADLAACAAIVNDWIDATPWQPRLRDRAGIAALFVPAVLLERDMAVAEVGGRLAGYLTVAERGLIESFYLAPWARGRGIGRALLDRAKARHAAGLVLRVWERNEGARRFYAREGFAEVAAGREAETPEGLVALRMGWRGRA